MTLSREDLEIIIIETTNQGRRSVDYMKVVLTAVKNDI